MLGASKSSWLDWKWIGDNLQLIRSTLGEHLILTGLTLLLGVAVAVPVALASRRWRWLYPPVTSVAGILYTIPSLAAYALLIPYTGLGSRTTTVVPLVTYTLLILVRNIVTGLDQVPGPAREAAEAMGYSPRRLLVRVELPLALPAILAGLRLAAVTTVGLATVASLVGSKNLGWLMLFPGFQQGRRTPILVGAVLAVLLAAAIDAVFLAIERLASPWRRADGGQRRRVEPRAAA
ncbi:MAG: osmoprotectant transport system permease protein [Acidimicrobiia bacterium]|nr:osmoprotectant transport system permease protein [Acidimicrobiia bacterium]